MIRRAASVAAVAAVLAPGAADAQALKPRDHAEAGRLLMERVCLPVVAGTVGVKREDLPRLQALGLRPLMLLPAGEEPPDPHGRPHDRAFLSLKLPRGRALVAIHGPMCWISLGRGSDAGDLAELAAGLERDGGWTSVPMPTSGAYAFKRPAAQPDIWTVVSMGMEGVKKARRAEITVYLGRPTPAPAAGG